METDKYTVQGGSPHVGGQTWNVIGPWPKAPHVIAAWGCDTKEGAEALAANMNAGCMPPEEE